MASSGFRADSSENEPRAMRWDFRDIENGENYQNKLASAGLDYQVADRFLELQRSNPERTINHERFVGHDQPSEWYEVWVEMGEVLSIPDPTERTEAQRKYLADAILADNEQDMPEDDEELDELFHYHYYMAEFSFIDEASHAHKAIYLENELKIYFGGNAPDAVSRIDWLNEAPFELMDQTVEALLDPDHSPVPPEREATARHVFGEPDIHPDAHSQYLLLDRPKLGQIKDLLSEAAEMGVDLDSRSSILLYDALDHDFETSLGVLRAGHDPEVMIQYPWLAGFDPDSSEYKSFPTQGDLETKHAWCISHSAGRIPSGIEEELAGKLIYEQLQAGMAGSLESAVSWLEEFADEDKPEILNEWLRRYSDTSLPYLAEAWRNRPPALLAGISDDPYEINAWAIGGEAETEAQPSSEDVLLLERNGQKFYAEPVSGKDPAIFAIERRAFPESLYKYSPNVVKGEQQIRQSVDPEYSFIVRKDAENETGYAAYCLAKPKPDSVTGDTKLYIFDFAVDSEHRGLGVPMFLETLSRAESSGISVVEFFARESASYRMATSPTIVGRLNEAGYDISSIRMKSATGKEPHHKLRLEKRPN